MKEKKIALLLFNYFPFGGLQKDFYSVSKELKKRNFQIKIFTGKWNGKNPENFEVVQLGIKGFSNHRRNKNFAIKVRPELVKFEPDLVFGFNKMPGLNVYFAADTCFKYKAKKTKTSLYRSTGRYKNSVEYEESVFGTQAQTNIFLLNEKQRDEFINEYNTDLRRLNLIPPGIPEDWHATKPFGIREELKLPKESKLLIFVGSDFKRKGLDRAIEALSSISINNHNAYLLVVGQDEEKPYKKLVETKGLKDRVIFLGPRKEVSALMQEAEVLIHPAREEAAGNVIIEAIISSLPILTCESVGFSSLVENYNSGLVLKGVFIQKEFNELLAEILLHNVNEEIKKNMSAHTKNKFFYSRFGYIADAIENYFDE